MDIFMWICLIGAIVTLFFGEEISLLPILICGWFLFFSGDNDKPKEKVKEPVAVVQVEDSRLKKLEPMVKKAERAERVIEERIREVKEAMQVLIENKETPPEGVTKEEVLEDMNKEYEEITEGLSEEELEMVNKTPADLNKKPCDKTFKILCDDYVPE